MQRDTDSNVCLICGESKDASTARFVHVRLGLDEPPEPVLCKCKDPIKIITSIQDKIEATIHIKDSVPGTVMDSLAEMSIDTAHIDRLSSRPTREVELRLQGNLPETMFRKMQKGVFENSTTRRIRERACVCWTGPDTNWNARMRMRSNGEATMKVSKSKVKVAPGYVLAISDEYRFSGRIMHVQRDVEMDEIRSTIKVRNSDVSIIARRYESEDKVSYAGEFEIEGKVTNSVVRSILCLALGTVGTISSMVREIDSEFMYDVRSNDHVVIDVPDVKGYSGIFLAKADGMKVYVFCYQFGYVVTITDPHLSIVTCMVTVTHSDLPEMTTTPDVVLAEMMMDGTLVYIDTLAMNSDGKLPKSMNQSVCPVAGERPPFIYRKSWDMLPSKIQLDLEPMPNDGVVLTNKFRTMRLKQPTIDLLYMDGKLNGIDNGIIVEVTDGAPEMEEDTVYEMDLIKDKDSGEIKIVKPRQRPLKKLPNSMDVIKRAIASANADVNTNMVLFDITSMSFSMRERTYQMAQAKAPSTKKVIMTFGVGRFQEWKQMLTNGFSYIAIDPEINYSDLEKRAKRVKILPYDFSTNFNTQLLSISSGTQTVLWARCTSQDFIRKAMPTMIMARQGIPAVFSFSISYHIQVISMLRSEGVAVFGCGFVHDSMSGSVGREPVTMTVKNSSKGLGKEVVSAFGKSTYIEPFMKMSMVKGLVLVKESMPDLWERVDSNTIEIMDRAVIMCS